MEALRVMVKEIKRSQIVERDSHDACGRGCCSSASDDEPSEYVKSVLKYMSESEYIEMRDLAKNTMIPELRGIKHMVDLALWRILSSR